MYALDPFSRKRSQILTPFSKLKASIELLNKFKNYLRLNLTLTRSVARAILARGLRPK